MKNAKYWEERAEQVLLEAERNTAKYLTQIDAIYREICNEINRKIKKIFDTYRAGMPKEEAIKWLNQEIARAEYEALKDELATMQDDRFKKQILMRLNAAAYRYRITRWEYIKQQIAVKLSVAADAEKRISTACYRNTVSQSYLQTMYEIQKGIGIGFGVALLPAQTIDRLLSSKWYGRNYSASIWHNCGKVANIAAQVLKKGVLSGLSIQEMSKDLMERTYTQSMYNATRLIRTEVNYLSNQGALESYREAEVDQYEFIATLDRRTSQTCREHDGKKYPRKDATVGVNYPPMHPFCRSTTAAVIDVPGLERLNKRAARDKNGKSVNIENMSYAQWNRQYVDNTNGSSILTDVNTQYLSITEQAIQRVPLLESAVLTRQQSKQLQKECQNLLRYIINDPAGTETAAAYNMHVQELGKWKGQKPGTVKAPRAKEAFIAIHNHPSGNTFAEDDIAIFIADPNCMVSVVIGNNGTTYKVEKTEDYNAAQFIHFLNSMVEKYPDYKQSPESYIEFMETLLKGGTAYGIRYDKK